MSDVYTYVMQHDTGLAPNPFWGTCTLAVCAPNHQGSRANRGDWIAGVSDKRRGHKLIYVMEIDCRVHMNDYFHDERFAAKKPVLDGTAQQRCGDNFYSMDATGRWTQHPNRYHKDPACLAQDTRHPWVFVARCFWYLGREAIDMPAVFLPMFGGRGARVKHPPELVSSFKAWVHATLTEGMNALPRDLERDACNPTSKVETLSPGRTPRSC
jgi:Nucleotide modification associated domain 2